MAIEITELEEDEVEEIKESLLSGEASGSIAREEFLIQWSLSLETLS